MRRAATQVLRSARRPLIRAVRGRNITSNSSHGPNHRQSSIKRERDFLKNGQLLPSSMYFRSFSVALVSSLVASGAYFAYRGAPQSGDVKLGASPVSGLAQQTRSLSSSHGLSSGGFATELEQPRERKALIVDNYQIYTGVIPGSAPLEKTTDDQGRKILEMMTPEQATQRIRRNEESFWVGRGKGVVRW